MATKQGPTKTLSVRLPQDVAAWIDANGGSYFLRYLVFDFWYKEVQKNSSETAKTATIEAN